MGIGIGRIGERPGIRRRTAIEDPTRAIDLHAKAITTTRIPTALVGGPIPNAALAGVSGFWGGRARSGTIRQGAMAYPNRAVKRGGGGGLRRGGHRFIEIAVALNMAINQGGSCATTPGPIAAFN